MSDIYLVIAVGYEGIDSIYRGFLTPDEAVNYYNYLVNQKETEAKKATDSLSARWARESIERLCIMRGSEREDFECVCKELGVGPNKLVLF